MHRKCASSALVWDRLNHRQGSSLFTSLPIAPWLLRLSLYHGTSLNRLSSAKHWHQSMIDKLWRQTPAKFSISCRQATAPLLSCFPSLRCGPTGQAKTKRINYRNLWSTLSNTKPDRKTPTPVDSTRPERPVFPQPRATRVPPCPKTAANVGPSVRCRRAEGPGVARRSLQKTLVDLRVEEPWVGVSLH